MLIGRPEENEEQEIKKTIYQRESKKMEEDKPVKEDRMDTNTKSKTIDVEKEIKKRMECIEENRIEAKCLICNAMQYKQSHHYIVCFAMSLILMFKIEFGYTTMFLNNINSWLVCFMFLDIITEQILIRVVFSEALLATPIMG